MSFSCDNAAMRLSSLVFSIEMPHVESCASTWGNHVSGSLGQKVGNLKADGIHHRCRRSFGVDHRQGHQCGLSNSHDANRFHETVKGKNSN